MEWHVPKPESTEKNFTKTETYYGQTRIFDEELHTHFFVLFLWIHLKIIEKDTHMGKIREECTKRFAIEKLQRYLPRSTNYLFSLSLNVCHIWNCKSVKIRFFACIRSVVLFKRSKSGWSFWELYQKAIDGLRFRNALKWLFKSIENALTKCFIFFRQKFWMGWSLKSFIDRRIQWA